MSNTSSLFLLLPAEIRIQIYGYIWSDSPVLFNITHRPKHYPSKLQEQGTIVQSADEDKNGLGNEHSVDDGQSFTEDTLTFVHIHNDYQQPNCTHILQTCSQIYHEATVVLYQESRLNYYFWDFLHTQTLCYDDWQGGEEDEAKSGLLTSWHVWHPRTPAVPLTLIAAMRNLTIFMKKENHFYHMSPYKITKALRYFLVASPSVKRLALEFAVSYSGHSAYRRDQSIPEAISDMHLLQKIRIGVADWTYIEVPDVEHFVSTITKTKGWISTHDTRSPFAHHWELRPKQKRESCCDHDALSELDKSITSLIHGDPALEDGSSAN